MCAYTDVHTQDVEWIEKTQAHTDTQMATLAVNIEQSENIEKDLERRIF